MNLKFKEPHALALDMRRDFVAFERNAFVACQGLACAAIPWCLHFFQCVTAARVDARSSLRVLLE